ncbi:probable mitochondrial chaperone bcs1 [Phtheirospermum japonicum]|uniref:Probable mitochondrial chaperone bcs1 n=1 Tax=Phtheirospermum japonicum TaxID=374723 RepID=A0A830D5V9_9LAMI|nr:probable mitochondrial chaperone bcs1 [Phtheirospermum japonicum]
MARSSEPLGPGDKALVAAASVFGFMIFLKNVANELLPQQIHTYLSSSLIKLSNRLSSHLTLVIDESDGLTPNHMFSAASVYLGSKISPSTRRIKINKPEKDDDLIVTVDRNQEITDTHAGVKFNWILQSSSVVKTDKDNSNSKTELRFFELSFSKKHRDYVLKTYLPYILRKAKEIKEEIRTVRLHTVDYNGPDYWSPVVLNHPATFETMAMDLDTKKELIEDLERFVSRKDYYRRVGKAWKRGYLFYGPPGTGKSSLVAAMANYLKFDVYDLDLREVQCNSDLRRLLIGSANRSILVIEDIDCNVGLQNREVDSAAVEDDKITLSGLLNFIDGLWSSCGDERIIVFTTNHKNRLDPALLRPGRMDVQLEMSYCKFSAFKTLAWSYLRVEEHSLFSVIDELLTKVDATPAEVAGELMKSEDADIALINLVKFLKDKGNSDGLL